ncbi:MAG: hypothetical protein E7622_07400 [Ruminococcaceae bacterium]|nr:hypothetical protein [Oscillospiraceae bacterium]
MKDYLDDWEIGEADLTPDDWTEENESLWNKLLPYVKEALFFSTLEEIKKFEALDTTEIKVSDDFKIKMNKLFRDNFGENCKLPHLEVEYIGPIEA